MISLLMKRSALILLLLTIFSCGGSKNRPIIVTKKEEEKNTKTPEVRKPSTRATTKKATTSTEVIVEEIDNALIEKIIENASTYEGVKYKYGGTTKKGMDCSGLVYTSFKKEGVLMPRNSRDMSTKGNRISLGKTNKGDLVFFKTNKNKNIINHVGLVVENKRGEIFFIHSTSSLGVIISSLEERYWKNSFVEVRRII